MSDDLINRLRALMAEIEARLSPAPPYVEDISPKLQDALDSLPSAYRAPDPSPKPKQDQDLRASDLCTANAKLARPTDYVPTHHDILHDDDAYNPEDFIGTGDNDPLGHEAMSRGR